MPDYDTWVILVNAEFLKRTGCSWNDLCGEEKLLRDFFDSGWDVSQFCTRWIEKYDLDEIPASGAVGWV